MTAAGLTEREEGRSPQRPGGTQAVAGRKELEQLDREVRKFVSERPVLSVALALTAGYVVGRIVSRF